VEQYQKGHNAPTCTNRHRVENTVAHYAKLVRAVLESIKPADEALAIARARRMQLPEPDCQAQKGKLTVE
jgi:hypothetical protein